MQNLRYWITLALCALTGIAHADLVLRLHASDYNPGTGTWTDSSGMNNHATAPAAANTPSLQPGQAANGDPAVRFDGDDFLNLTAAISESSPGTGFTAFALIRPDGSGSRSLFAGAAGSFQWRVDGTGQQRAIRTSQQALGQGSTVLPAGTAADFSTLSVQVSGGGVTGGYRFNGANDGNTPGSNFPAATTGIGRKFSGASEFYAGDIVELRIYNTPLSLAEIMSIENQLMIPEPSSLPLLVLGGWLLCFRRKTS